MDEQLAKALEADRVIDITTTGRKTGESRRIEIWFHRHDGAVYVTGMPVRPRSWYANMCWRTPNSPSTSKGVPG